MKPITIFSFGYEGWGSRTDDLVDVVDTVESTRGFHPPLFVDARFSRSVRAAGFRDRAFELLLGARYLWLKGLGNPGIADGRHRLHDVGAIDVLLDNAVAAAHAGRRVIYFCSCGVPPMTCHRHSLIVSPLLASARARGLDVTVAEWPGPSTQWLEIDVSLAFLRLLRTKALASTPAKPARVRCPFDPAPLHMLAWGATLRARAGDDVVDIWTGPPLSSQSGWYVPVLGAPTGELPRTLCYGPRSTREPAAWSETAIYTLAHRERIEEGLAGGVLQLEVGRPMRAAAEAWARGQHEGVEVAVVVADANNCVDVLCSGVVRHIAIDGTSTKLVLDRLQRRRRSQQELVVKSTGLPIAPGYIRPYAIIHTPEWL